MPRPIRIKDIMGLITAEIELSNPITPALAPLVVEALVDTRAMTICIPEHVAVQLQLTQIETREVTTADERPRVVPYVRPIQIKFQNRRCFTGALVIGDSGAARSGPHGRYGPGHIPRQTNDYRESAQFKYSFGCRQVEGRFAASKTSVSPEDYHA